MGGAWLRPQHGHGDILKGVGWAVGGQGAGFFFRCVDIFETFFIFSPPLVVLLCVSSVWTLFLNYEKKTLLFCGIYRLFKKEKEKKYKRKKNPPGSMLSTQGSPLCAANLLFLLDSFVLFCLLLDLYLCALIPRWCTACFSFFSFFFLPSCCLFSLCSLCFFLFFYIWPYFFSLFAP